MIKIGVLGAGHLGKIHLKLLKEIEMFELVGFYDPNEENAQKAAQEFNLKSFEDIESLLAEVDAVDIVTPTLSHFDCAMQAIKKGKHVFIEKPITNTLEEASSLLELSEEASIKAQVGHVERFNPAFLALDGQELNPMFIETHRLAQFNPRGTDVAVVLDLMIHDIDIVLSLINSNVRRVSASGVAVISETPDIANARLEFDNGCVANLTASRISIKNMRKTRLFQKDAYISIDFLNKETEIISLSDEFNGASPIPFEIDTGNGTKYINFEKPEVEDSNAIKMELEEFAASIAGDAPIRVPVHDGYQALQIAHQILEKIEKNILA
jgi:predicted dehydrogenase